MMTETEKRPASVAVSMAMTAENLRGMVEDGWFDKMDPRNFETLLENIESLEADVRRMGEG